MSRAGHRESETHRYDKQCPYNYQPPPKYYPTYNQPSKMEVRGPQPHPRDNDPSDVRSVAGIYNSPSKRMCSALILILVVLVVIFVIVATVILYFNYVSVIAPSGDATNSHKDSLSSKGKPQIDLCHKKKCSLGICVRGVCQCIHKCAKGEAVCGSDFLTYPSICHLHRHACRSSNFNLTVQYAGSCREASNACEALNCPEGSKCIIKNPEVGPRCECTTVCPVSKDASTVCGSDGEDHNNLCELQRQSCLLKKKIVKVYNGMCDPCRSIVCEKDQVCLVDANRVPKCQCNKTCPTYLSPVCGSDGITYSNECILNYEACRTRIPLTVIFRGDCSSGVNPCAAVDCRFGQHCSVNKFEVASCQCISWCPPIVKPVCGSDGKTYNSHCHIQRQSCLTQKPVSIAYVGTCGIGGPCRDKICPFGSTCVEKYRKAECECVTCRGEYAPVCGTNHKSFSNRCELQREKCLTNNKQLNVLHSGPCDACKGVSCGEFSVCETDLNGYARCVCPSNCSQDKSGEVCASDMITYGNICEMKLQSCKRGTQITILHKGRCDQCRGVNCKYGARCHKGHCICPTNCPKTRNPVCGSDQVTYSNECIMKKKSCNREEIHPISYGECRTDSRRIITDIILPTLHTGWRENPCDNHKCVSGGICELDEAGLPHCKCDLFCSPPSRYEPVCASDGELYESECRMTEYACDIQVELTLKPHSECVDSAEDTKKKACNGGSPLTHPTTKEIILCNQKGLKCPPGSYCQNNTHFAQCCRDNSARILVIEEPMPNPCSNTKFGCCADNINLATGPNRKGCPETCSCNSLGAVQTTCSTITGQCICRPGVGGENCDRCLPGFYGLNKIGIESIGCTPCGCSRFGSLRMDCNQMTGQCVCKPFVSGRRCTVCQRGKILTPDGCVLRDPFLPSPVSCQSVYCHLDGVCKEVNGIPTCVCHNSCSSADTNRIVCGSDGRTYNSECQLRYEACRLQKDIVFIQHGPCQETHTTPTVRRSTRRELVSSHHSRSSTTFQRSTATRRHAPLSTGLADILPLVTPSFSLPPFNKNSPYFQIPYFSGSSFIRIQDMVLEDEITINFVATHPDGIILSVIDPEEAYKHILEIRLSDGFLEVIVTDGKGLFTIRTNKKTKLNAESKVTLNITLEEIKLHLNKQEAITGLTLQRIFISTSKCSVWVGGLPRELQMISDFSTPTNFSVDTQNGFSGCISELKIGQKWINLSEKSTDIEAHEYVSNCQLGPCFQNPCKNGGTCFWNRLDIRHRERYTCSCKPNFTGRNCESSVSQCHAKICPDRTVCIPSNHGSLCIKSSLTVESWAIPDFRRRSYIQLMPFKCLNKDFTIELWFMTRSLDGLLLTQSMTSSVSSLTIGLRKGFVIVELSNSSATVMSSKRISLDEFHQLQFEKRGSTLTLKVDGESSNSTTDFSFTDDSYYPIYLGSHNSTSYIGLNGAIQYLKINTMNIDHIISSAVYTRAIRAFVGAPCYPNPCGNGGLCMPILSAFSCRCTLGYVGTKCTTDLGIDASDRPIQLDGNFPVRYPGQMIKYPLSNFTFEALSKSFSKFTHKKRRSSGHFGYTHELLEVSFRTNSLSGLLLWASGDMENSHQNYLALSIIEGYPHLSIKLGNPLQTSLQLRAKNLVVGGSWHVVRITRHKKNIILKVDNHRPSKIKISHSQIQKSSHKLYTNGDLWLGGTWSIKRPNGVSTGNFKGCIDRLLVEGQQLHLLHNAATPHLQICDIEI